MSDPAQLERTLSEALDKFTGAFKELLKELRTSGGGGGAGGAAAGGGGDTSTLCSGFESITSTHNQTDTMKALVDSAADFAGRCALLVVKGEKLASWRTQGFDDEAEAGLKKLNLSADGNSGWKQAVQDHGPVAPNLGRAFFQAVGAPGDNQAYLVPLLVKGHPVAMLYADAGADETVDPGALRLLSSAAGMHLEISAARAKAEPEEGAEEEEGAPAEEAAPPPPPPPPPPAGAPVARVKLTAPDLTNVPSGDHDIHKKAFRFCKVLVDELVLYNKDKVAEGKKNRDVYSLLQEDIDKSRLAYQKKFGTTPAGKVDYLHLLIVAQLGDGDPSALGSGYPGPLV